MKIFINARFLTQPISGVQRYAIECSRQIKKIYPDVAFVCPAGILHTGVAAELGAVVIGSNKGHIWEQYDLPNYLKRNGSPPLLSLCNTAPLYYPNNFVTIHDLAFYHHPEWNSRLFSAWYNMLMPRLAHKSRHIFTVSQTIKNEITECYTVPGTKVTVTGNGVAQTMLDSPKNNLPKEKIILSVGTFNIRKNHHNLINAFLQSDIKHGYRLVMIGDKHTVFKETGLDENTFKNNNIEIYSGLTTEELVTWYHKAETVASLSRYEGFGIPLLEGLYYGCKIICADIPVYHEVYDGYASFCSPYNVDDIAALLGKTCHLPPPGEERVGVLLQRYNYSRYARCIIDKIREIS